MGVIYQKELMRIREILERKIPSFPVDQCQLAARVVNEILGLEEVAGRNIPTGRWHAWNKDPDLGLYVDLSLDQFSDADKVSVLPFNTSTLVEIPDYTLLQLRCRNYEKTIEKVNKILRAYRSVA